MRVALTEGLGLTALGKQGRALSLAPPKKHPGVQDERGIAFLLTCSDFFQNLPLKSSVLDLCDAHDYGPVPSAGDYQHRLAIENYTLYGLWSPFVLPPAASGNHSVAATNSIALLGEFEACASALNPILALLCVSKVDVPSARKPLRMNGSRSDRSEKRQRNAWEHVVRPNV
ncbi:hypothetical protein [Aquabacterium humicola]|uniref:hypothetical protein n=1 Tax=Aquabacterium humicola TaxID=3237377 RepID=UPI0025427953|nr:hypothetical protein [Rubrivivax pictus]